MSETVSQNDFLRATGQVGAHLWDH